MYPPQDWSLRLARPEDAEHLPTVELAAGQLFSSDPDLGDVAGQHAISPDKHQQLIAKGHCLVALTDERIAGFIATEPFRRELHICELSVHPDFQKSGIGAGLMRGCMIDAKNSGFNAITLTTFRDVPWNGPFYAKLGFVEVQDQAAHLRLASELKAKAEHGLPLERRCAMIHFLD